MGWNGGEQNQGPSGSSFPCRNNEVSKKKKIDKNLRWLGYSRVMVRGKCCVDIKEELRVFRDAGFC